MNYKLALALLFSAPLMALSIEEAQRRITEAQSRLHHVEAEITRTKSEMERCQERIRSVEGKHEHRDSIMRHTTECRRLGKRHNAAVKSRIDAIQNLEKALLEVGPHFNVVSEGNCKYRVEKVESKEEKPAPIRHEATSSYTKSHVSY